MRTSSIKIRQHRKCRIAYRQRLHWLICFADASNQRFTVHGFYMWPCTNRINPLPQNGESWRSWGKNLLKTLWEKEKMLFLLFPQCFLLFERKISCFELYSIYRLLMLLDWTKLKFCNQVTGYEIFFKFFTLSQTSPCFYLSAVQVLWKHCGEIVRYEQLLLFPTVFSTRLKNFLPFS